jgi:hypothetical protein
MALFFPGSSECWILIEFDHLFDDLILCAIEVRVIIAEASWIVSAFLSGPLFFVVLEISFEFAVVLANDFLRWVVEAVTDVVGTFWYVLRAINIIANQRFSIRSETFQLFCVESAILYGAIVPILVLKLKIVVEKVLSFNEFAAIPLSHISTLQMMSGYKSWYLLHWDR